MYFVGEVFCEGHSNLERIHLDAVRDMANRVGFSVLEPKPGRGPLVHRIKLHITMDNPYFLVRLEEKSRGEAGTSLESGMHTLSEVEGGRIPG